VLKDKKVFDDATLSPGKGVRLKPKAYISGSPPFRLPRGGCVGIIIQSSELELEVVIYNYTAQNHDKCPGRLEESNNLRTIKLSPEHLETPNPLIEMEVLD